MSDCEFDCGLICVHCGYQARRPGTRRTCSVTRPLSLLVKLHNYEAAIAKWLKAGRPVRDDATVARLEAICHSNQCGLYREGTCGACGCPVSTSRWAVRNKIRMATENCPKNLWPDTAEPVAEQPSQQRRVRVGFLTPNLVVGGVESWLCSLVREWRNSQTVECVGVGHVGGAWAVDQGMASRLIRHAPVVSSVEIEGALLARTPIGAAAAVAEASDVLVAWSCSVDQLSRIARPGLPIIGVSHGCHDWWMHEAAAAGLIKHWVAVSAAAILPCPCPPRDVHVIPNGVDFERCRSSLTPSEAKQRLGIDPRARVAGYIGRISEEKRVLEIAIAARHLPFGWRTLIVGTGHNPEYLRRVEGACGPLVIRVREPVEHVGDVWRACDVGVIASAAEGYCLSGVEALAAGVPLASTPVGVLNERVPGVAEIYQPARPVDIVAGIAAAYSKGVSPELPEWIALHDSARMAQKWANYCWAVHHSHLGTFDEPAKPSSATG